MFNRIKYLVMDVDGTLTDGKIYIGVKGEVMKSFSVKDGVGIKLAESAGITPIIITARNSRIVENRAKELNIDLVYQGINDKASVLCDITDDYSEVAYIGDDITDIGIIMEVKRAGGVIGAPMDAVKEVLDKSDYISQKNGGDGAVREFVEWILGIR